MNEFYFSKPFWFVIANIHEDKHSSIEGPVIYSIQAETEEELEQIYQKKVQKFQKQNDDHNTKIKILLSHKDSNYHNVSIYSEPMENYLKELKKEKIDSEYEQLEMMFDIFIQKIKDKKYLAWDGEKEDYIDMYENYSAYNEDPFDNPEQCDQLIRIIDEIINESPFKKEFDESDNNLLDNFKIQFERISKDYEEYENFLEWRKNLDEEDEE